MHFAPWKAPTPATYSKQIQLKTCVCSARPLRMRKRTSPRLKSAALFCTRVTATAIFPSSAVTANATRGCLPPRCGRWEIPAFLSEARTVDAEPLMRFVLSAFQIVSGSRKWRSEDVLAMLKTGITSFTAEELAQLENYVYTWKLNGASAWCSPFTKHPDGFGKPMDDTAAETLRTLNVLRERVTTPLIKFSERTAHAFRASRSPKPFISFSSILIWSKASRYFAARSKMPAR